MFADLIKQLFYKSVKISENPRSYFFHIFNVGTQVNLLIEKGAEFTFASQARFQFGQ